MKVEELGQQSIDAIVRCDGGNGWKSDRDGWVRIALEVETGLRTVLVARSDNDVCGYGSLLWQSAYPPFRLAGVPEIHDLVTAFSSRRQGVATRLIVEFERIAAQRGCISVGLGVGLYADYGPAQRLYASLGYLPDGRGVTYGHRPVVPGSSVRADDDLVLWLTKTLR